MVYFLFFIYFIKPIDSLYSLFLSVFHTNILKQRLGKIWYEKHI